MILDPVFQAASSIAKTSPFVLGLKTFSYWEKCGGFLVFDLVVLLKQNISKRLK
jgi:hypothetical protein